MADSLVLTDRYQLLVDAITDYAVFMLDADGYVASWNPGAQRFKGYAAHEIVGRHFSSFYTPEDRAAGLPARALATAASEGRFENEGWRVRKDGARFWAHVVIDPIRRADGAVIGYAKITRDLTERRAAEESLRHSEQQFRLLVRGVTDYAIYMLDPNGKVSSWNLGAQRIKGYATDEIVGEHFSRFYTPEDRAAGLPARALLTAAVEGRFENEGWRVRKDGSRFWAHVVIDAISDDDGVLIGFAKITRDITERREVRAQLEQAREALFQSQKMEAIGQLTGGVAHDFNNLLMAILGSLELVRKRLPDDPQVMRLIDNAIQGAQRGASLTQRMLAFARRQDLRREAVDAAALIGGMADLFERSLGSGTWIEDRLPVDLPMVETDPNQLEAAVLNLVLNARDAMPRGGSIVLSGERVELKQAEVGGLPAGRYVRLAVIDTGEGMSPEVLARATEPFFTSKGVGKGTGLGLSMVQGLVQQSGGALQIDSKLGQGATVSIWLPVCDAPPSARGPATPEAARSTPALRVLVVDDDALVLLNTTAMLEDLGHAAVPTAGAAEALAALDREPFDLVVTDQAMPMMTGVELAEQVNARWPELPLILATGFAELPSGAGDRLPKLAKPFSLDDLARIIGQVAGHALETAD